MRISVPTRWLAAPVWNARNWTIGGLGLTAPSIRWRLTIFYTTVLGLMLVTFSCLVYAYLDDSLRREIDAVSVERAKQVDDIFLRLFRAQMVLKPGDVDALSTMDILENSVDPFQAPGIGVRIYDSRGMLKYGSDRFLEDLERIPEDQMAIVQARNGMIHRSVLRAQEGEFYAFSRPLILPASGGRSQMLIVQILTSLRPHHNIMNLLAQMLIIGTLLATALAFFTGAVMAQTALTPINSIIKTAEAINRTQDLSKRIVVRNPQDEIGRLAGTINDMLGQIEDMFDRERQFMADVSHELRTPLTTIRGEVDLMERSGRLDPEGMEAVQSEAERMSRLVGDLLMLARADAGVQIQRQPVDLDTLLLEVYRGARTLAGSHHTVQLGHEDRATVVGDRDRLKQMLLNLVDNALKYSPPGCEVTLSLYREKGLARLVVADNGPGIPPEHLPRLFDRFYRVDKARSRGSGGTGLGLSIVQWVAAAHGGNVTVQSAPGKGTTFTVVLPECPS